MPSIVSIRCQDFKASSRGPKHVPKRLPTFALTCNSHARAFSYLNGVYEQEYEQEYEQVVSYNEAARNPREEDCIESIQ